MNSDSDRIEKTILLRAPRERVWQAVSDATQFGYWFGVEFDGPFTAGTTVTGKIVTTKVDAEVAEHQKPYEGMACDITVERVEPMSLLSFRWQPYPLDSDDDASDAPTTLVEFKLTDAAEGTQLTVIESGFDRVPLARRAEAFKANEEGWQMQTKLIEKYLTQSA